MEVGLGGEETGAINRPGEDRFCARRSGDGAMTSGIRNGSKREETPTRSAVSSCGSLDESRDFRGTRANSPSALNPTAGDRPA